MLGLGEVRSAPSPRVPRPVLRFDLWGALAAAAAASLVYVAALFLPAQPPRGLAVALFAAAPLLAFVSLPILLSRARATADHALSWAGSGLAVATAAMLLQLVGLPFVAPGGGPLHTGGDASALLYLSFHAAFALGAAAGALDLPRPWQVWGSLAGLAVVAAAAADLIPLPALLRPDQTFTGLLVGVELVLAGAVAGATWLWVARAGRAARSLHGWVGVALSLSVYDLVLNAAGARRFDPIWWASLSLRVATYGVLAAGTLLAVLRELHRLESFTETQMDLAEKAVGRSWASREVMLNSATRLSSAISATDVAEAVVLTCQEATELPRVSMTVTDDATGRLRVLATVGWDAAGRALLEQVSTEAALPGPQALRTGRPVILSSRRDVQSTYPGLQDAVQISDLGSIGAFPLLVGQDRIGLLTVAGPETHLWSRQDHEVLAGIAAQAAQALQRALLYERQRTTAEVLQRGLLPRRLPRRSDFTLAARYVPGADGLEVGGDWYDCIETATGQVALVVGDVMGKGLDAASLMGEMRHALRAFVTIDPTPTAVMRGLDRLAEDLGDDIIVTVVYLLLDPTTGEACLARAGHLPPLVLAPDGVPARFVEAGGAPPIGVPVQARDEVRLNFSPGTVVMLFSDGLVEDHRSALEEGMASLLAHSPALVREHDDDLESLADAVLSVASSPARSDDVTLLILRLPYPRC